MYTFASILKLMQLNVIEITYEMIFANFRDA